MMFSLRFAVVLLFTFGINGQPNDINTFHTINLEKGYPFGKLRLAEEGKNEELIPTIDIDKSQLNQDQSSGIQPLPSPCIGTTSLTKLAYPKEKTKYIQCRDEFHYEIFTCPNGGEYNEQTNSCDLILPMIDKCEQEKPCLNDGQCTLLSNSTFKCICRHDWTGDRCETPINSCVKKPCGPNAECRPLKTTEYDQDYVCVCHGTKGYGPNCQEVVPNPCLTTSEQFFQYAFSQHAYIQCDGDLIYFQPCGPLLYWNQEEKICDRKRPPKIDLPALLKKFVSNLNDNQQENGKEMINQGMTSNIAVQTEQQNSFFQNGKENEKFFAFVPARVANRQQLQANMFNQQDQLSQPVQSNQTQQNLMSNTKQWPNQQTPTVDLGQNQPWSQNTQQQQQWTPPLTGASSINSNLGQSPFGQNQQQWTPPLTGASAINPSLGQSQFGQNNQQQWTPPLTGASAINSNLGQSQFGQSNQQQWTPPLTGASPINSNLGQSQFGQNNQQQWRPPVTGASSINPSLGQSQFGQSNQQQWTPPLTGASAINSNLGQSPFGQNQQQWTPPLTGASAINSNLGQSQFGQNQQQQWTPPLTGASAINSNLGQSQFGQSNQQQWTPPLTGASAINPSLGQSQFGQSNQQQWTPPLTGASSINPSLGQSQFGQSNQQQWKPPLTGASAINSNLGQSQFGQNQQQWTPPSTGASPINSNLGQSQFGQNQQQWIPPLTGASPINSNLGQSQFGQSQQQWTPPLTGASAINSNLGQSPFGQNNQQQNFPQQNQAFSNQQWSNQVPDMNTQNNQHFGSQSWQGLETIQNQPQFPAENQKALFETTTPIPQNVNVSQGLQNPKAQAQDQSWQNKPNTQFTGYQSPQVVGFNTQNTQSFISQPQSWQSSQTVQSQPQFPAQYQQTLFETTTTIPQNVNRFQGFQNPNTQEQDQSWQKKQNIPQIQNQVNKPQSNQIFAFQPKQWPETSKQIQQSLIVNPSSEIQNTQFGYNQQYQPQGSQLTDSDDLKFQTTTTTIAVPTKGINQGSRGWQPSQTFEQRQTLDSVPTLLSGSWKSRS